MSIPSRAEAQARTVAGLPAHSRPFTEAFFTHEGNLSDKWEQYLGIYDAELLRFILAARPVSLLEIGVQNGGSLEIWARCLPSGSRIVGIDVDPACAGLDLGPQVQVLAGDASDSAALDHLLGGARFDVIVDDGSHRSEHVIQSFEACFPRLAPGGLYFVEDLHCSYFEAFGGGFRRPGAAMEHFKLLADALNADHFEPDAKVVDPQGIERLSRLGREIARITFYDSAVTIEKHRAPKSRSFRRALTGVRRPVLDLPATLVANMPVPQLGDLVLSSSAVRAFEVPMHAALLAQRDAAQAERRAAEAERGTAEAYRQAVETQREVASLHAARAEELLREADHLAAELEARCDALDTLRHELAQAQLALRDAQSYVAALLGSTSWRITAPMRLLVDGARSPRRRLRTLLLLAGKARRIVARDGLLFTLRRLRRLLSAQGVHRTLAIVATPPGDVPASRAGSEGGALLNAEGALVAAPTPLFVRALALPLGYEPAPLEPPRLAVVAHIFYPDLAPEILGYLRNIPWGADIFVSTDTAVKQQEILAAFAGWQGGQVEVRVMPNRGRDIAPKVVGFRDVHDRYEYVLHLHGKKSLHSGEIAGWREYLCRSLLGSPDVVRGVFEAFRRSPLLGIVAPCHWEPISGWLNWGFDFPSARALAGRMGLDLARDQPLDFPSGSMFWARSAALRPLLEAGLTVEDFPEEAGQVDGTLAHAVERLYFRICEHAGHTWLQVADSAAPSGPRNLVKADTPAALDALLQAPVVLGDPALRASVAAEARRTRPEYAPIRFVPEADARPRLTLLLPTYHPASLFGGVATAVDLFERIARAHPAPDLERRIVVTTDERRLRPTDVPSSYKLVPASTCALPPRALVLCPPSARPEAALSMRRDDVLLASAWWDAAAAFTLMDQQRAFFGAGAKLGYFVQDFEPNFSAWSASWALANETYGRPADTLAMVNSEPLAEFLDGAGYRFPDREVFQPIWNAALAPPAALEAEGVSRRQPVVLVYWRPSVHRNLAELALAGLARWLESDPITYQDWQVWGVGEDGPDVPICRGHALRNLGKLNMRHYDRVLRQAQIGLSLMLSPHPSYPPLEMAAYGMVVVTNRYGPKDLSRYGAGFEPTEGVAPSAVAAALGRAAARWRQPDGPGAGLDRARAFASEEALDAMARRVAARLFLRPPI